MTKIIKDQNNVYKMLTQDKVKQLYCFDFYLCNDIDKLTLGMYFELKQKYTWLLQKQRYKKLESHIHIDLNHLNVNNQIDVLGGEYKWTTKFSFLDFELDNKITKINEFVLDFFKPINLDRLSEENTLILVKYLSDMIKTLSQRYLPIEMEKYKDSNKMFSNFSFLLSNSGYNDELESLKEVEKINEYINIFESIESKLHEKINKVKTYLRISKVEYGNDISNLVMNWNINCSNTNNIVEVNNDLNKNYYFEDEVSSSTYYIYKNQEYNMKNRMFAMFYYNQVWNYYFAQIRENLNIIYSPRVRIQSLSPFILKVDNQTENDNLDILINAEENIIEKINNSIDQKSIEQYKKTINNSILDNIESQSVEFYTNIYQTFEDEIDSQISLQELVELYRKLVEELSLDNVKDYIDDIKKVHQSYTYGERND